MAKLLQEELVFVITGGASGIGRACVHECIAHGHTKVAILDRDSRQGEQLCKEINSQSNAATVFVAVDVAAEESVERAISEVVRAFGRIDIAIHAAGIGGPTCLVHELKSSDWQRVLDIDLSGTFFLSRALMRYWRSAEPRELRNDSGPGFAPVLQRGSLLNIASVNANYASAYMACLVTAKHGVSGLSKNLALENVEFGIRVNTVSPGVVYTPIMDADGFDFAAVQQYVGQQAMKRFAHPEEIASCCYYIVSDEASFVTGTNLVVDAGWSAH